MGESVTQHLHRHLTDIVNNAEIALIIKKSTKKFLLRLQITSQVDTFEPEREENYEKQLDSIEYSQQNKVELNHLFVQTLEN